MEINSANQAQATSAVQSVALKAIDGQSLVLQTKEGEVIYWPINNLPGPIEIGSELAIELKSNTNLTSSSSKKSTVKISSPANATPEEQQRRNLLEALIN